MGVHGLWELLAPVGRRVSVETLAGKKLAIDASIWMVQFMKAMRDEKGEMVKNAHLLGFFRRICKLLFLRTKPVFVFDGATPALKRRTVIARRRQRENAQAKIRKTAEKLLLNHLKAMRLKELADNLENQKQKKDAKGKKVIVDRTDKVGEISPSNDIGVESYSQEKLDEMLAASLAAEYDMNSGRPSSSHAGKLNSEEDDSDGDEEMILPVMHGDVDPAVLASLPPSMQLDLLGQMRERLMADNRQKYQKVKKIPAKFSELQIQSYLKTVAFRREIDVVQKAAAGRGIGGVQTSRIASEANREFIFSSSFTGDKQVLTSAGVENNGDKLQQMGSDRPSLETLNTMMSTVQATSAAQAEPIVNESGRSSVDDVETYVDGRGRVRVSRVRAMGIRMTRDLQRNLELMKEIEQERISTINTEDTPFSEEQDNVATNENQYSEKSGHENNNLDVGVNTLIQDDSYKKQSESEKGLPIQISFEEDAEVNFVDDEDDVFARLAAGDPVIKHNSTFPEIYISVSASDSVSEDGAVKYKGNDHATNFIAGTNSCFAEAGNNDESDVEWEEGICDFHGIALPRAEVGMSTQGNLEEEAEIQEAIKRSLEDLNQVNSVDQLSENKRSNLKLPNVLHHEESKLEVVDMAKLTSESGSDMLLSKGFQRQPLTSVALEPDKKEDLTDQPYSRCNPTDFKISTQDSGTNDNLCIEVPCTESVMPIDPEEFGLIAEESAKSLNKDDQVSSVSGSYIITNSISNAAPIGGNSVDSVPATGVPIMQHGSISEGGTADISDEEKLVKDVNENSFIPKGGGGLDKSGNEERRSYQESLSEAYLEEELLVLDQERKDLGDEQRRLERNAESVSSEMFAECQELLQMFGLPYIIAPMEAEAQCAFMELSKFVDGVVTDDSDVFLFGARSVYKNIFDDRKYVETYLMKDIETELGLTREKLIRMALLLGSDYTEGVSGIGIVNAVEVVNAFPEDDGFHKFRQWIESPDPKILGKANAQKSSRKKGAKVSDNDVGCLNGNSDVSSIEEIFSQFQDGQSDDVMQLVKQKFMDTHRNISKNWHIPSTFPNEAVISAYVSPQVDDSKETFAWGKPDLYVLRKMCWEKFGWGTQKAEELLLPVLKEYNKHETQLRLEAFYTFNERFAKIRSRRIQKAVTGITNRQSPDLTHNAKHKCRSGKAKRGGAARSGENSERSLGGLEDNVVQGDSKSSREDTAKKSRKRCMQTDTRRASELEHVESSTQAKGTTGRGRGRGRGTDRRRGLGRGNRTKSSASEVTENILGGGPDGGGEDNMAVGYSGEPLEVRRSRRPRKPVNYTLNDLDIDDMETSLDGSESSGKLIDQRQGQLYDKHNEQAMEREPSGFPEICVRSASVHHESEQQGAESPYAVGSNQNYFEIGSSVGEGDRGADLTGIIDPPFDADISKDYLHVGGGFCVEEDDNTIELERCALNPEDPISQDDDYSDVSASLHKIEPDVGPLNSGSSITVAAFELQSRERRDSIFHDQIQPDIITSSNISEGAAQMEDCVEGRLAHDNESPFSAIPFLRRKRRKS